MIVATRSKPHIANDLLQQVPRRGTSQDRLQVQNPVSYSLRYDNFVLELNRPSFTACLYPLLPSTLQSQVK